MAAKHRTKYIFVLGGVLSGLGKGITAASIAKLLKSRGLSVNIQKCDPYLNVDAGTINPAEHGEVFVTKDGAETDLDLGHYERYLDQELDHRSSLMSGKVLLRMIQDERRGKYLGEDVQIIPHMTMAIKDDIMATGQGYDVHIVEIGGTVGDYESLAFIEAIRDLPRHVGRDNCLYVHVVYLPYLGTSKEIKTKPAQNAVRELRGLGISPDVLVARCEEEEGVNGAIKSKLSAFCGVEEKGIAILPNADSVYQVPLTLEKGGIANHIAAKLKLKTKKPALKEWRAMVARATDRSLPGIDVGIIAKYMDNEDTYMSVFEALRAAGWNNGVQVTPHWVDAEELEKKKNLKELKKFDGILIPGGFGTRGVEGKIRAAEYAMKNKLPYLGLCLGLQVAVVAAARQRFGMTASSVELDPECDHPVIDLMADQKDVTSKGGTMRLGNYECRIQPGTIASKIYKSKSIQERHRHRYEVSNRYRDELQEAGVIFSGLSPGGGLVEMIEMKDHPFFVASQFHPEFRSRPNKPHPMFDGFIAHLKKDRYNKHGNK